MGSPMAKSQKYTQASSLSDKASRTRTSKKASSALVQSVENRIFNGLDRRHSIKTSHRLGTRNLYIFPSLLGFVFLGAITVLWLLGTNYQNNLVLGLSYLLLSLFIICILHTYANLAGIVITYKGADHVFAGEYVQWSFELDNQAARPRENVLLHWRGEDKNDAVYLALNERQRHTFYIPQRSERRGVMRAGRLMLETRYPLGLFRCWTWLRWEADTLVYPEPIEKPLPQVLSSDNDGEGDHPMSGGDDFYALQQYRPGDSLKLVAWKSFAKEQGLLTKEFSQNLSREVWLDFDLLEGSALEERLSILCFWVLRLSRQNENFGLKLPQLSFPPDCGENHRVKVLEALALHGVNVRGRGATS